MKRSKISQLPRELLDALNALLVGQNFSDYRGAVEWLAARGVNISLSSLHRHGAALEEEFQAAIADARRTRELARAAKETGEDESGELMRAASEILQDNLLRVSLKAKQEAVEGEAKDSARTMAVIAHAFAKLGSLDLSRRRMKPGADPLAVAMDVLQRFAGYVGEKNPALASEFAELLEPFGEALAKELAP